MAGSVIQLRCSCNNYPWGKKGKESLAARYCSQTPGTDFKIDENTEYAEMWMGTYPDTPSYVLSSNEDLQDVLNANKEKLLGKGILKSFGSDLPFLPKILSIAKALPLQIHPDKELAARLHEKDPEKYTDDNHKPEIAIALTKFEVFVGWKPLQDIQSLFALEPLQGFLPDKHIRFNNETIKSVCQTILEASEKTVEDTQAKLAALPKESFGKQTYIPELLPRLQEQYTKQDNGTLVALLLMNFLVLSPGDCVYVPADGIHAYLSGDIVECMARSNNVINTGFCPRADRDSIELFTAALTFSPHSGDEALLPSKSSDKGRNGKSKVYAPPMSEFDMLVTQLQAGESEIIKPIEGPSIMIVTSGSGTMKAGGKTHDISTGYIFFIGQGVEVTFESKEGMDTYWAYAEA
ncbi:MAG: hypothetical protein M1827_005052 [Pycnora praestabilis]|nr:MAG: hypothetical protein M1827_005052 [Pycnora praestabilis]